MKCDYIYDIIKNLDIMDNNIGDRCSNHLLNNALQFLGMLIEKSKEYTGKESLIINKKYYDSLGCKYPQISIENYLERIHNYIHFTSQELLISLIYLNRIYEKKFKIEHRNIHKLMALCIIIAQKYHEDCLYKNFHYSRVVGIDLNNLNKLEIDVLTLLDFNAYVTEDEYYMIYVLTQNI